MCMLIHSYNQSHCQFQGQVLLNLKSSLGYIFFSKPFKARVFAFPSLCSFSFVLCFVIYWILWLYQWNLWKQGTSSSIWSLIFQYLPHLFRLATFWSVLTASRGEIIYRPSKYSTYYNFFVKYPLSWGLILLNLRIKYIKFPGF